MHSLVKPTPVPTKNRTEIKKSKQSFTKVGQVKEVLPGARMSLLLPTKAGILLTCGLPLSNMDGLQAQRELQGPSGIPKLPFP